MSKSRLIYTCPVKVSPYEIDPNYKANLLSINHILDQGGMSHISHLGYSMNALQEMGYGWALYQRDIDIQKDLDFEHTYRVETQITGRQRIFTYRDYRILDDTDNLLVASSSIWILFDLKNRSFVKTYPEALVALIDPGNALEHLPRPQKIRSVIKDECDFSYSTQVRYSDIDMLGHLSNHHHCRMLYDALPQTIYDSYRVRKFRSNFLNEASYGDEINIKAQKQDIGYIINSFSQDKILAKAVLELEEKKV